MAASITPSPASLIAGTPAIVTLAGAGTSWTSSTQATLAGGAGAAILSQSIAGQAITLALQPGTAAGPLTLGDTADGATCTVLVTAAPPHPDLVTQARLSAAYPALAAAQAALLPALATSASRLVRKWCNRSFERQVWDQLYTVGPNQSLLLREFPVNQVLRLATDPTAVITIANSDAVTNQRATVQLATTGNVDAGLVVTGVTLTRYASGVAVPATITWAALTPPTIQALATAVAGLGAGWTATVADGYGLWPAADLRAVQGALPALGTQGADLTIHVADLAFTLDEATGHVTFAPDDGDPWESPRWGPAIATSFGDVQPFGGRNGVRCVYDAGLDVVPEDVQQAVVEAVGDLLNLLQTDQRLSSETDGAYSYARDTTFADYALTKSVMGKLAPYRSHRA